MSVVKKEIPINGEHIFTLGKSCRNQSSYHGPTMETNEAVSL